MIDVLWLLSLLPYVVLSYFILEWLAQIELLLPFAVLVVVLVSLWQLLR